MAINHSCPTRMLASESNFSPVMAELRELKADIYELGRSLDNGTTARRSHNELSCTKVSLGLTGSSSRPPSIGTQGLAVLRRSSCRSEDNHGARPPSPPPRFSRPTKTTHKEVMRLAYNGVSDVPRLVQRAEESARLVSSEKGDALQALRAEKDETVRLREALWQAGGFERRWKELVEESRVLKRKLESTERIRLRQKELIAELQAAEVDVDFPVAAGVAPRTFTQSRGRADTRHTESSPPMHRSRGQRSEKSKSKANPPPGGQPHGTAKQRGVLGPQRRRRRGVQRDGCFCASGAGSRSLEVGGSVRLRSSSVGQGSETKAGTTANTRRHDKSSKSGYTSLVRFQASDIKRNTKMVAPRTAGEIYRKERLVARRQGGSGALDGRRAGGARRSRLSQGQERMKPGIDKTSRLSRSLRGLEVHNKMRRSSQMSTKVTVPRRSSRRDAGFCAPTASSSGKVRQWEDFA